MQERAYPSKAPGDSVDRQRSAISRCRRQPARRTSQRRNRADAPTRDDDLPAHSNLPSRWSLAHGKAIDLGPRAVVMGILNVTPDSFSDGGLFDASVDIAANHANRMIYEGADIVDVGGESTRPDAAPVEAEEEQRRVLPVVRRLAGEGRILSIDTYRTQTARLALEAGAHAVNDVWGAQREPDIARVAAEHGAGLCLMHTGREREKLADVIEDQRAFLSRSIEIALRAGAAPETIVLDPGFGFAKDTGENLQLIDRLGELGSLGFPILVGTSRKRFVRTSAPSANSPDVATAATSVLLRERGAAIFRVHDVSTNREALDMADAVIAAARSRAA